MNAETKFKYCFNKMRVVLPVIHVQSESQALKNVELAQESGADGVWLINHTDDVSSQLLLEIGSYVKTQVDIWIGYNFLDLSSQDSFTHVAGKINDGLWNDNAGVTDNDISLAQNVNPLRRQLGDGLYFGGVAFKYQTPVQDFKNTANIARNFVDVITTSGIGTGHAADLTKIIAMHEGAEGHPLAVASGITPTNVHEFLPYINAFLVATGVSKDFNNLDADLLKSLVDRVNS